MHVLPYLNFEGRCEEALDFYREAVGARINGMLRYSDHPGGPAACEGAVPPAGDKIMHASFMVGETLLLATDGMAQGDPRFEGMALTLAVRSDDEARRRFDALAAGGVVRSPLEPTFFASQFGVVTDRFGVTWMVVHLSPPAGL